MRKFLPYLALSALLLGAVGCSSEQDFGTKGGDVDTTAELKRIQDNPNMPPQAKAAAEAQLRGHSQGKGGGVGK